MTADRSAAYSRVVRTLHDVGPAKLHEHEQARIREAADVLVFASASDVDALAALDDAERLACHLRGSGRWTDERAAELAADVAACGPTWIDLPGELVATVARAA